MLRPTQNVFNILVQTAQAPSLGQLHRLKAYDVLCSFVEVSSQSSDLALDKQHVCEELLNLYLDRHDSLKAKHNKRVLAVLIKTSCSLVDSEETALSIHGLVSTLLHLLFHERDQVRARPAFDALAAILRKGVVPATSLKLEQSLYETASPARDKAKAAQDLIRQTFTWFNRPESALPASHFLNAYLDSLESSDEDVIDRTPPIWAEPLIRFAASDEIDSYTLRNYVLPDLFERNASQYWKFLDRLDVSHLSAVKASLQTNASRALGLVSLQVGVERGLVDVEGMFLCVP